MTRASSGKEVARNSDAYALPFWPILFHVFCTIRTIFSSSCFRENSANSSARKVRQIASGAGDNHEAEYISAFRVRLLD